jgi:protein-tyrosine phosphatase
VKILFVCTGNICRSPLAEGILRNKLRELTVPAEVDSAGFESFHVGDHPDHRAIVTAKKHGIDITTHVGRLFNSSDFNRFDQIYIMDDSHFTRIRQFAYSPGDMEKVDYIMNVIYPGQDLNVEDPWYEDMEAFERVYHKLDKACSILAGKIAAKKISP